MKLLVLVALIGAAVAAPVEYRCVKPAGRKYGDAHQKKCSKFKDSSSCLAYKFRNGAKCQWKKGKIVTVTEYFSVKPLPTYTNNAKPSAIVQRQEVEYDVRKWSTLEYQNLEEMEYHGEMEAEANMAGSLVDSTEPCPRTLVRDCDGQCAPAYWIGNGLCDNGGKASASVGKGRIATSCKAVVAAECEKKCKSGVDGKWWTKKGSTKNAADAYLMKECSKKCNAATGMKDRMMKRSGCTWIMPKLADYGVAKHHGVYNFNCPQFWNDGGDCISEERVVSAQSAKRHRWFQRKALKMALNTIKSSSAASVSVVAMAAMAAADAQKDSLNALHVSPDSDDAPTVTLEYGAYMNCGRWNHNPSRVQPLINELLSTGYSVQLKHDATETSWEDLEAHGFISLKTSAGEEIVRRGGFQHNRKLRAGGSWDPKAVAEICEAVKKRMPIAAAA